MNTIQAKKRKKPLIITKGTEAKHLGDRKMKIEPEGFLYIPDFLSLNEQAALLHELRSLIYKHDVFRGQKLKRGYAQFGYSYVSTGRKLEVAPMILLFLQTLIKKASPYYPNDIRFTQCIVTHYPSGTGIGWHTDAPQFGDYIIAVSLAGEARLQFRPNSSKKVTYEVKASPGSLYLMQGSVRWNYQHQVVPVKVERYSFTFRCVTERKN
jgi:alkylated DNA repair dioxygenase AlkB